MKAKDLLAVARISGIDQINGRYRFTTGGNALFDLPLPCRAWIYFPEESHVRDLIKPALEGLPENAKLSPVNLLKRSKQAPKGWFALDVKFPEDQVKGAWLCLAREDLRSKTEAVYYFDIIGLPVFLSETDENPVGTVSSIFETAAHEILVVKKGDGTEVLFPFIDGVVKMELSEKRILIPDFADYDIET